MNEPITREEMLLNAVATGVSSGIKPITREEKYLAYIGGQDVIPPEPITRKEQFLSMISPGGSGGTGLANYVNYNVTDIPDSFFRNADFLETVAIGSLNNNVVIGDYSFYDCLNLKQISWATEEAKVGTYAFYGCKKLQEIGVLDTVGERAFQGCSNLQKVKFPKRACIISPAAFVDCTSLKTADIGRATLVGNAAFYGCTSLEKVIGFTDATFHELAFGDCFRLTAVILDHVGQLSASIDVQAFDGTPMLTGEGHIYVRDSMYEIYRSTYEPILNELIPGFFDILFRKIEDYPEICG